MKPNLLARMNSAFCSSSVGENGKTSPRTVNTALILQIVHLQGKNHADAWTPPFLWGSLTHQSRVALTAGSTDGRLLGWCAST